MSTLKTPAGHIDALPARSFVRAADLPGSPAAARAALHRAAEKGGLLVVSRGVYYKGVQTRYGVSRPSLLEIALEVLGSEGSGPTGYSAARTLGLTTQVPASLELAVCGRVKKGLEGVSLHTRNNDKRRRLSYLEIALLEVLRNPSTVDGGWAALVGGVKQAIERSGLRLNAIADAVPAEHSPAVRERFGRLSVALAA